IVDSAIKKHQDKDYAGAIELYQQAIGIRPKNAGLWFNLAGAYYAREDYAKARDGYNKASELDPKGQVANLYLMALIDEHFDRAIQAIEFYQKYLAAAPSGQYAAYAKERIKLLTANPKDTIKIKSETELAKIKEAEDSFHKAISAQQEKKYEEAIVLYQKAINLQLQNPEYPYALGTLFQQKGDIDLAINWYQKAIELDPKNKDFPKVLSAAYEQKAAPIIEEAVKKHTEGDLQNAIRVYQQALEIVPKQARLWTNLATAYQNSDNFQAAREAYLKGFDLDPKGEVGNWYFIGAIDEHFGQGTAALKDYQKYLSLAAAGQYVSLTKDRVKALSANPNDTTKLQTSSEIKASREASEAYDQAIKLQQANKFDEALPLYQKAVQLMPKEAAYSYSLGTLYQAKGNFDGAIEWYKKAVAQDPKNKDYPKFLAAAIELKAAPIMDEAIQKHSSGNLTGALELYQKALAIAPNDAHGWTNLAALYQQMDDFTRARECFQKALDLNPKGEIDNYYFIALIDEHFGQGSRALQDYQKYVSLAGARQYTQASQDRIKVLTINPNNTQRLTTQAEAKNIQEASSAYEQAIKLQQENKFDEALPLYQKAIGLMPAEPAYNFALATLYQSKGDFDNAIEWYKKAASLDPKNKDYPKFLNSVYALKASPLMDEAIAKHGAGDIAAAIELYQKALAIVPNNAHGWTNLAGAYQAIDNFAKARDSYQKALTLDSKAEAENWYFIATIDEHFAQGAKALQEYQRYIAASPKGNYVALASQRIKELTLNPSKTQKLATQTEQKQSAEASTAFDAAVKLQQENKFDEAIAEYKKAIALSSNDQSYWYSLGTCYQAKGDNDEAINSYSKASALNPQEASYKQLIKQLKAAKAAPLLESAFKKQTTKDNMGNYDLPGAIADYEAALKIDDDPTTRLNLGTAHQGSNNLQKALGEYKKALTMDPKQCDAYYYLGTIYENMKQPALALAEYKKCIQCSPVGSNAAAARARVKALGGPKN
ncbi:MAG: tetratricopeptide repeat protein, partial [Candidatus Melainabacteria bacterium]|nr:tetratricopeptide repeat protein [Candidatus Melainabacteria bacterium]